MTTSESIFRGSDIWNFLS